MPLGLKPGGRLKKGRKFVTIPLGDKKKDAMTAIDRIKFGDIWRRDNKTIAQSKLSDKKKAKEGFRVDVQPKAAKGTAQNIHVQSNGGNSVSVAVVILPHALQKLKGVSDKVLLNAVTKGLKYSLKHGLQVEIAKSDH